MNLKQKMKDNKEEIIGAIVLVGLGIIIGKQYKTIKDLKLKNQYLIEDYEVLDVILKDNGIHVQQ